MSGTTLHLYARRVESLWSRYQDRAVLLSPKDWQLVCTWFERGIPLELIGEVLDDDRERRRAGKALPRRLGYFAPAVDESWTAVVEGRVGVGRPEPVAGQAAGAAGDPAGRWRQRSEAEPTGSRLAELLAGLLRERRRGVAPERLDERLDRELPSAVGDERRAAAESEVERRLAAHRGTMPAAGLEETRGRAVVELLRRRLGLPRLADDASRTEDAEER